MKKKLSEDLARQFLASSFLLEQFTGVSQNILQGELEKLLESPKDPTMGDLAFPCFSLAKKLRSAPPKIAAELSGQIKPPLGFSAIKAAGGYLNFYFDSAFWAKTVLSEIQTKKEKIGDHPNFGNNQTAIFDYASPNVAKPMSIGHLRSAVIGQALVNIHQSMGFKTIGINYLGDWGVQFGKLAWAHLNQALLLKKASVLRPQIKFEGVVWDKLVRDVETEPDTSFDYLYALYVIFHAVAEVDPELESFGRDYFLRLEKRKVGLQSEDPQEKKLTQNIEEAWQKFVRISLVEYNRVYVLLGTKHDLVRGESYHEPELDGVVEKLKKLNLLRTSEGAEVVDLDAYEMPPCLIKKSDGATLYATRDIAAAAYRHDQLHGDRLIYVVGAEQSLHFRQVFKVLELMGYPWAGSCVHVPFGLYRFKDGKMSTRRGNVIFLEDVLDRAVELVKAIIKEKNPALKNADEIAQAVGTGAVIFNDLMNDRQKNIDFDWDRLLDFNGDTGPYVQYIHVRCRSVLGKWNKPIPTDIDFSVLHEKLELDVLRVLGKFDDITRVAYEQLRPNWIAHYLLELAKAFSAFYYEHRILEGDEKVQQARIVLVDSVRLVLHKGLSLMGIQAPEAM